MEIVKTVAALSDADLLRRVEGLAVHEREATVELLVHLAELDRRRLHVGRGYGSLFSYCTQALRLSEHAAYNRIEAARASRRFPEILELLANGALNLSTVRLLAPHLTADNRRDVLAEASGRSKREVEELVARLAPRADVAASIRRLPSSTSTSPTVEAVVTFVPGALAAEPSAARPPARPVVAPLAPERYRVQFTMGREAQEKLRRVQELLRREIPDGDLAAIFERALTLLLKDITTKKLAATARPRGDRPGAVCSRSVPAEARRAVWSRDEGQCTFRAPDGRRCPERVFLELHHVKAYARGGKTTAANLTLHCRAHNAYEADRVFGRRSGSEVEPTRPGASQAVRSDAWGALTAAATPSPAPRGRTSRGS